MRCFKLLVWARAEADTGRNLTFTPVSLVAVLAPCRARLNSCFTGVVGAGEKAEHGKNLAFTAVRLVGVLAPRRRGVNRFFPGGPAENPVPEFPGRSACLIIECHTAHSVT